MEKVFVTGGTGVIGKRVVKMLDKLDFKVIVASRSKENDYQIKESGGIPVRCDLFDEDSVVTSTKGCDYIVHLATKIPKHKLPKKKSQWRENDKIRVQATKNLIAAASINNIEKIISQSVLLVFGDQKGSLIYENTQIHDKLSFMLRSAVTLEKLLEETNLNHSILRFGKFYGPDAFDTKMLINNVYQGKMPIIGNRKIYWNFIHVDDAASAIVHVILNFEKFKNKTINVSDFHPVEYGDFISKLGGVLGSIKAPSKVHQFVGRIFLGADLFRVFMSSFRLVDNKLEGWTPKYIDVYDEMKAIVKEGSVLE